MLCINVTVKRITERHISEKISTKYLFAISYQIEISIIKGREKSQGSRWNQILSVYLAKLKELVRIVATSSINRTTEKASFLMYHEKEIGVSIPSQKCDLNRINIC